MPSEELTARGIEGIAGPSSGRLELWDKRQPSLVVRVTDKGHKSFCVQYKSEELDGKGRRKTRRVTLGEFTYLADPKRPKRITLKQARTEAQVVLGAVAKGEDPQRAIVLERARLKGEAVKAHAATVSDAIDVFAAKDLNSPSQWKSYERPRLLRRELGGSLGGRPIGKVTAKELSDLQKRIAARSPLVGNRFAMAARVFFRWVTNEYDVPNPSIALKADADVERDSRRDRTLKPEELQLIWAASGSLTAPARDFVRILMLIPQREKAVANMKFGQIEGDEWNIPRAQKKQKQSGQLLPLSPPALAIINDRRGDWQHVFCSGRAGDKAIQNFSRIKMRLDELLGDRIEPWRFHDFRRSFRTWAAREKIDQAVAKKILDHGQAKRDILEEIYNLHAYQDEQRDALTKWADAVIPRESPVLAL